MSYSGERCWTSVLISRTPYRFSLYGGGLDYPEWYLKHPTVVLCAGLDYYCYQTVRKLPPFFSHNYRVAYSNVETTATIDAINHPAAREVVRSFGEGESLEITHVGDLPAKSGIGSSSAFTVGLINSLNALNGKYVGRSRLAEMAIDIEQNVLKENVGFQDQCAAAFGGLVLVEADKQGINPRRFVSRKEYVDYITESLIMGFDGVERFSGEASKRVTSSLKVSKNMEIASILSDLSVAGIKAFGDESDITEHARLTKESRDLKLQLNGDYLNTKTNELIESTERAGSLCTRVMGAGGGGFFVCWAPPHRHQAIKDSVRIKTWVEVKFSKTGSQVIFSE